MLPNRVGEPNAKPSQRSRVLWLGVGWTVFRDIRLGLLAVSRDWRHGADLCACTLDFLDTVRYPVRHVGGGAVPAVVQHQDFDVFHNSFRTFSGGRPMAAPRGVTTIGRSINFGFSSQQAKHLRLVR